MPIRLPSLPRNSQNWFRGPSGNLADLARTAVSSVRNHPGLAATLGGGAGLALYGSQPPSSAPATPATAPSAPSTATPGTPPASAGFRPLHPGHSQPSATTPQQNTSVKDFLSTYWPHLAVGGAGAAGLYGLYQMLNRDDEEKQASFSRRVVASPAETLQKHPLIAGFLIKCAARNFDDQQILAALTLTAERSPAFKSACINAGLVLGKGASRAPAREVCFP